MVFYLGKDETSVACGVSVDSLPEYIIAVHNDGKAIIEETLFVVTGRKDMLWLNEEYLGASFAHKLIVEPLMSVEGMKRCFVAHEWQWFQKVALPFVVLSLGS